VEVIPIRYRFRCAAGRHKFRVIRNVAGRIVPDALQLEQLQPWHLGIGNACKPLVAALGRNKLAVDGARSK
jgi:hypothetical protein